MKIQSLLIILLVLLALTTGCGSEDSVLYTSTQSVTQDEIQSENVAILSNSNISNAATEGSSVNDEILDTSEAALAVKKESSANDEALVDKEALLVAAEATTDWIGDEFTVTDGIVYINGIEANKNAVSFTLQNCDVQGDYSFLSKYSWITKLNIADDELIDLSFLESMPQLIRLELTCSATDFSAVGSLSNLEDLTLLGMTGVEDLDFLEGMKLTSLSLDVSEQLSDITGLDGMDSLEELRMFYCSAITDFSVLQSLKSLKILDVSFTSFNNLCLLDDLLALEELNIGECPVDFTTFSSAKYNLMSLYTTNSDNDDIALVKKQFPDCEIQN